MNVIRHISNENGNSNTIDKKAQSWGAKEGKRSRARESERAWEARPNEMKISKPHFNSFITFNDCINVYSISKSDNTSDPIYIK